MQLTKIILKITTKHDNNIRYTTIFTLDLSAFYYVARHETRRERLEMKHASEIFPQALKQLIEIGEKARNNGNKGNVQSMVRGLAERGRASMQCKEKQLKQLNYKQGYNYERIRGIKKINGWNKSLQTIRALLRKR